MKHTNSGCNPLILCPFLRDLELGDSRLSQRLNLVLDRIEQNPSKTFPMAFPEESELDAFYRLVNNPRITQQPFNEATTAATVENIVFRPAPPQFDIA